MKTVFLFFCLLFFSCSSNNESQNTYEETRKLLNEPIISNENFIKLFQIADDRIEDLIAALNDKDKNVRYNAQKIIRYMGNPKATESMYQWLSKNALKEKEEFPTNPIPIPINNWEYRFEEKSYMYPSRSNLKGSYALFLDNSDKAQATLNKFIAQENANPYDLGEGEKLERLRELQIGQTFQENGDLAKAVLQTPFFQVRTDEPNKKTNLEKLKSELITYNAAKTKALIGVQNEDGTLEVVAKKVEDGWKFYSILRVSVY